MLDFIKRIRFWWKYRHLPHPASREFLVVYLERADNSPA
jgi:hypothetical protein